MGKKRRRCTSRIRGTDLRSDPQMAEALLERGILSKIEPYGLKVLGDGELTKKLTVVAKKFTKSAAAKIEAAGGTAEVK